MSKADKELLKVEMRFSLEETEVYRLTSSSIERVFNTAIRIIQKSRHPDAIISEDDLTELKRLNVDLWKRAQDAVFRAVNNMEPQDFDVTLG